MKLKLLYLLLLLLAFMSGCGPKSAAPVPNNTPEGTFTGKFKYIHKHAQTGAVDSVTTSIQLQIEQNTGFKVTGDTSVHAGSYGSYLVNSSYTAIDFMDKTFPTTGTPAKYHLNGVYSYSYDGTNLSIAAFGAFDTLSYVYSMKRIGN
ncbi:MAG: hypothetical protein JWQ63_4424 [Mucilaginibacter sp.]|jgi:hypothetical protein|nr:hypothetical protein [Mucilaginibacter sp.]